MVLLRGLFLFALLTPSLSFAKSCLPFFKNSTHPGRRHRVKNYQPGFEQCSFQGQIFYTIRSFQLNGTPVKLAVHPQKLSSKIISNSCLKSCKDIDENLFLNTFYGKLLTQSASAPFPLRNDGLTQGHGSKVALTIDMCPSRRGFSQRVFTALVQRAKTKQKPIPVGIAMTRAWKKRWPQHFQKLKDYQAQGLLSVEWINHSANHIYQKHTPLRYNFLLRRGTNMEDEVLGNEISLIQSGVTPSSFFRFPGLVSNEQRIAYVSDMALITLGSKAWLAKHQHPKEGSIILIHGNKNEPIGEKKLLRYMRSMDSKGHQFGPLHRALNDHSLHVNKH